MRLAWLLGLCHHVAVLGDYTCGDSVKPLFTPGKHFLEHTVRRCPYKAGEPPDYGEYVLEMHSSLSSAEAVKRRSKAFRKELWYELYAGRFAPGIARGAGMDSYEPAVAIYLATSEEDGELPREETEALEALVPDAEGPFCSLSLVACRRRGGQLRVVAVKAQATTYHALRLLGQLSELEALWLALDIANEVPLDMEVLDALHWPKLRNLEVAAVDVSVDLRSEFFAKVIGRQSTLQVVQTWPDKYNEFDFSLASWCGLRDLRDIRVPDMNIHTFPDCFADLVELRNVYLPCNYLTEAPRALAGLPELRTFVGFRQGEYTPCHLRREPRPRNLQRHEEMRREHGDCKLVWETALGDDGGDNPRILCPWVSLRGTLRDWMDLRWPKLEKLWLDGNFIAGRIPENLPEVWPDLRSLDLYRNELTGAIPASLAEVGFGKLQLQGNHLSGEVPPALFQRDCCYFNIAANANLTGCVPAGTFRDHWRRGIPGTKITKCPDAGGEEL